MPAPTGTRQSSTSEHSNQNLAGCHVCNPLLLTPPSHKRTKVKNKVPKASSRSIRQLMSLETTSPFFNMVTWMFLCFFRSCLKRYHMLWALNRSGLSHGHHGIMALVQSPWPLQFFSALHGLGAFRCAQRQELSDLRSEVVGKLPWVRRVCVWVCIDIHVYVYIYIYIYQN